PSIRADSGLYGMRAFASSHFAAQKRGFLRRKVPLEEMISHTVETITRPLMNLPREMTRDAVRSFRAIQRHMGDIEVSATAEDKFAEILWMANQGITHQMLRDEIFCQLAKQVTGNPSASAMEKGWSLMGVLLYAFRPTQMLLPHLEAFIDSASVSSVVLKRFLRLQIGRVKRTGSRTSQMSQMELRLAMTVPSRPLIFGGTLAEIMADQELINRSTGLPRVLEQLTSLITSLGGEHTEGLFRVPGDGDAVSMARLQIEAGQPDFSSIHDPNIPASLLKEWLRDLADPLIPESLYERCISTPSDAKAVHSVLDVLPDSSLRVVKYLLGFLSHLLAPGIQNATKMDSSNLALVFSPSFLRNPVSDLKDVFANSSSEQTFVMTLI
ncbi:RhoGAP-domain-containing protein, partial [Martensiomyces pterosporus]